MKISYIISNILFIAFLVSLVVAIVFFEIGLSSLRKQNERKTKESNTLGLRWLIYSGVLLALSIGISFLNF
jgi:heme/copper-type cytochrome/quinol oxidase subunit 2